MGVFAEEGLDHFDDSGHTCHAADKDDLVNVACLEIGVSERLFTGIFGPFDKPFAQLVQFGPGQGTAHVFRAARIRRYEG